MLSGIECHCSFDAQFCALEDSVSLCITSCWTTLSVTETCVTYPVFAGVVDPLSFGAVDMYKDAWRLVTMDDDVGFGNGDIDGGVSGAEEDDDDEDDNDDEDEELIVIGCCESFKMVSAVSSDLTSDVDSTCAHESCAHGMTFCTGLLARRMARRRLSHTYRVMEDDRGVGVEVFMWEGVVEEDCMVLTEV